MRKWVLSAILAIATPLAASAETVETSPRPIPRPDMDSIQLASAPTISLRPALRPSTGGVIVQPEPVSVANARFERWIKAFRGRAIAKGIDGSVFDRAFRGISYDREVIERDRNQSEFTKTIWDYLDSAASDTRIKNGKAALRKNKRKLQAIEERYGVEKEIVVAIWGLESAYGSYRGSHNVIEALATLAFDGRRGKFFEAQLIAALRILQSGDIVVRKMTGSWAGAMGHTQFIPTSYLAFAVDFTGDGKRDIWSDDPSDALASTAAYLAKHGWVTGQPWGVEVRLPKGFEYTLANRKIMKSPADWARLGVIGLDGKPVPNHGAASILLPAGGQGAAFMIFKNFAVIERYNTADAYVIGVGHLSDRIMGGDPIQAKWPRGDRALTFRERKELQRLLTRKGFDTQKIDGKIGPLTIAAVRAYQVANGLKPDGYPSLTLLKRLRKRG